MKPRALETVIHNDEIAAQRFEIFGCFYPVRRERHRSMTRQKQRFVAHMPRAVMAGIDQMQPAIIATIATRNDAGFHAPRNRPSGKSDGRGRLARAANRKIANAQNGQETLGGTALMRRRPETLP